ncbi:SDR family oxidoreductase [Rhodospirillaceae bacterium]|nr:SDR family oxidoreductase [Rhodospirillaceae bacterium]
MTSSRQTALITGAGNGIGRAIAIAMAENDRNVVSADIDLSAAETTAATIRQLGVKATALKVDVGETAEISNMIQDIERQFGRLDILVNNAGVTRAADIMELTEADWDKIHRVNAKGVFFCLQNAAKQMIEQGNGGRIINIASIAGRGFSGTSNAAYSASKGAVISLTKTAAQQLAKHDITVNSICPGVTTTEIVEGLVKTRAEARGISVEAMVKEMTDNIPLKRANEPEDIAAMAIFLASSGARNITGQSYNVDGGLVTS